MTSPLIPPQFIEAPPAPPASYGLFSVALGPMSLETHGIGGGVQYLTDWCAPARLYPSVCDSTPPTKTFDAADALTTALPFRAYATLQCGSQTFDFATMEARVRRRLAAGEQTQAETALWGTTTADVPGAFQTLTVTGLPASASIVAAVAALEQQLASCYGHPGILHVRPRIAAYLAEHHQLWKDGSIWRTQRGNAVSIGDGYSGRGPANQATTATTEYMYITGRVAVWRSDDTLVPDPRETFDRSLNQYMMLAERDYALGIECCIATTEVTLV